MADFIFWLLPAALLIWLIILAIQTIRLVHRKTLLVVEPIGSLINNWQVARCEPNMEGFKRLFSALASINLSSGSLLEITVKAAASRIRLKSQAIKITLLNQESIAPLAEQLTIEQAGKSRSFLVGPLGQIDAFIEDDKLGRYHHLSLQAAEHGYLALAIASAFVHGRSYKPTMHRLEGLIILEPVIDRSRLDASQPTRFLSVAPLQFVTHLYSQIFPKSTPFGLNAAELETLSPRFAEADLTKAVVIGSADLPARHRVLQSWGRLANCFYLTVNPEDADLPTGP